MNNANIPSGGGGGGFINTNTSSITITTNNNNNNNGGFTGIHSNVLKSLSTNKNPLNSYMSNTTISGATVVNNKPSISEKQQPTGNFNETSSVPLTNYYSMNNQFSHFHNGSNGVVSNGSMMNNQQQGFQQHYPSFQPYNNNNNNGNIKKYRNNNDHLLDQSLSYQIDFNDQFTDNNQSYGSNNYYQNPISNQPPQQQQPLDHNFGNNFFLNNSAPPLFGSNFGGSGDSYQNKPLTTSMGPILGNQQPSRPYQQFNYQPNNSYSLNNLTNVINTNSGNQPTTTNNGSNNNTVSQPPPLHYNNSNYQQYYVNSDNQYPAASTSTTSYSTPHRSTLPFEGGNLHHHHVSVENFNHHHHHFQDPNTSNGSSNNNNTSQFRFEVNGHADIIQPLPTTTTTTTLSSSSATTTAVNTNDTNVVTDTSSNSSSTANGGVTTIGGNSTTTTSSKSKPQKSKKKEKKKTTPLDLKPIEILVLQELLSSELDSVMKELKVTYTFDQDDRIILEFKKITFEKVEQQVRDLLKKVFFRECYCEMKEERRREIQKKASKYNSLCFFDSANVCHVASLSEDDMEKLSKHIYCFIGVYKLHEKESIETILKHNYKYQIKPQKDKHNNQIENEIALYCHCPSEKAKAKLEKKIAKRGDSPSIKIKLIRKCHPELLNPTDYSERDNKVVLKDNSDSKELKKWLDRIEIIHIHDITGRTELFGETKKELENYLDSYNRMAYQITRDIDKKKKVYVDIAIISDEFDTNTKNSLKQKTIEIIRGYKKMIPSDSLPVDAVQNLTRYITTMKLPIGVYIDHSDQTKMFYIRGVRMEKVEEAFRTFDVEMKKYLEKTVQISFTSGTEREMTLPILLKKVSKASGLRLTKGTSDLSYSLTGPIKECEQFMKNEYADIIGQVKQSILYMNNNNFNFL